MGRFEGKKVINRHLKVTLKPIMGIKPQIYIPSIYIILTILLITFVTASISKRLSFSLITSNPSGALVYIDDVKVGSTPLKVKKSGKLKSITLKKANFMAKYNSTDTKNDIHFDLVSSNGKDILEQSYKELARWSLIRPDLINSEYRIPSIFSDSISDYFNSTDFDRELLNSYILLNTKNITNQYILSDYLKGLLIAGSDNKLTTISSVRESAKQINRLMNEMPNIPILFYKNILKDHSSIKNSELTTYLKEKHEKSLTKRPISFKADKRGIKVGGVTFNYVPSSNIKPIDVNFIHNIIQDEFYISDKLVSKRDFELFIKHNPKWRKANISQLMKEGLVDKYYLDFNKNEQYITNISYFAAIEWCNWANGYYKLPEGFKLTLPTESMWHAAKLKEAVTESEAWQWTSEDFSIYDHFLADSNGQFLKEFTETRARLVVGNNKYNTKKEAGRGVQDSAWCTPFLSFRPVLAKE